MCDYKLQKLYIIVFIGLCANQLRLLECRISPEERPFLGKLLRLSSSESESESESESNESQERQNHVAAASRNGLNDEGGCEDKIPNCSGYLSMCCSMKEAMNSSCPKTCKFCSETPATVPPSAPGGGNAPDGVAAPTAATGQDPCSPTDPPSVTVDASAPGQTTTTQAAITAGTLPGISMEGMPGQTTTTQSSLPGVSMDGMPGQTTATTQAAITAGTMPGISFEMPGQTTTTTQASITGPAGMPGMPG